MQGLGRRTPTDFSHIERFPLTADTAPTQPVPVVIGVNWYVEFDHPQKDSQGRWWIARDGNLTSIRGGHCVCLLPTNHKDPASWWTFYDQGHEGACVGFGCSRMMSVLNRKRYDARWLWNQAKTVDEWPDTNPGDDNGTSVRAGLDVLRTRGHVVYKRADEDGPSVAEGISANRWATSADDAMSALGRGGDDAVPLTNNWGRSYPHTVWMPVSVLERLRTEDGEVAVVTDR